MNRAKIFTVFTFLLAFADCISAQSVLIPGISTAETSASKRIKNLKIGTISPNEIEGYKFFSEGKLNKLKLGISTKEDVKLIFGVPREEIYNNQFYDYDSNWLIQFVYFDERKSMISQSSFNESGEHNIRLIPLKEYVGKIYSVRLVPKKAISFSKVTFSNEFSKTQRISYTEETKSFEYCSYQDLYGLTYDVKVKPANTENSNLPSHENIMAIEYEVPYQLRDKMFVEQK